MGVVYVNLIMSSDLVWACLRKNSSFLVKSKKYGGVRFTTEPGNLMNKHSYKYSGLANSRAIGVEEAERGVVLTVKSTSNARKPAKLFAKKNLKRNVRRAAQSIVGDTAGYYYRADLRNAALARLSAIHRSQRVKGGVVKAKNKS